MLSAFRICNNVYSSQRTTKTKPITNVFFFPPAKDPQKRNHLPMFYLKLFTQEKARAKQL